MVRKRKKLQSSLSTFLPPKTALLRAHLLCLDIKHKGFIPDVVVWLQWDEFDFKRWKFCVKKRRQKVMTYEFQTYLKLLACGNTH